METKTARRFLEKPKRLVFKRLGGEGHRGNIPICRYWLEGRCNKNPCKFLHPDSGQPQQQTQPKHTLVVSYDRCGDKFKSTLKNHNPPSKISDGRRGNKFNTWKNPNLSSEIARASPTEGMNSEGKIVHVVKKQESIKGNSFSVGVIPQKAQKELIKEDSVSVEVITQKAQKDLIGADSVSVEVIPQKAQKELVGGDSDFVEVIPQKAQKELVGGDSVSVEVIQQKAQKELVKGDLASTEDISQKTQKKLCQDWVTGNCVYGENCRDLHSWFSGSGFSLVTELKGHKKAVTGISRPTDLDKLFSGSKDGSFCIWDCNSGRCINTVNLGSEIGCVTSEGLWIFIGLQNAVKACNVETQTEVLLSGANGLVHSVVGADDMVFGGVEDGSILARKSTPESSQPIVVATLQGHKLAVLSLFVGANCLYSGSKDETIRVWDVKTLQCLHTLEGHSGPITSVLCWDSYLLSGSLDNTLKVWALTESGKLEVVHEIGEETGVLALRGIHDAEAHPILLCSRTDGTVCLYNLPSFTERGRIFTKGVVSLETMEKGGLFFTGDAGGRTARCLETEFRTAS